jgi:hypothetical protein
MEQKFTHQEKPIESWSKVDIESRITELEQLLSSDQGLGYRHDLENELHRLKRKLEEINQLTESGKLIEIPRKKL